MTPVQRGPLARRVGLLFLIQSRLVPRAGVIRTTVAIGATRSLGRRPCESPRHGSSRGDPSENVVGDEFIKMRREANREMAAAHQQAEFHVVTQAVTGEVCTRDERGRAVGQDRLGMKRPAPVPSCPLFAGPHVEGGERPRCFESFSGIVRQQAIVRLARWSFGGLLRESNRNLERGPTVDGPLGASKSLVGAHTAWTGSRGERLRCAARPFALV